jgi:hypothetical protein
MNAAILAAAIRLVMIGGGVHNPLDYAPKVCDEEDPFIPMKLSFRFSADRKVALIMLKPVAGKDDFRRPDKMTIVYEDEERGVEQVYHVDPGAIQSYESTEDIVIDASVFLYSPTEDKINDTFIWCVTIKTFPLEKNAKGEFLLTSKIIPHDEDDIYKGCVFKREIVYSFDEDELNLHNPSR